MLKLSMCYSNFGSQVSFKILLESCELSIVIPSYSILYNILGALIKERKIYHTGEGYFIVTPNTYFITNDATEDNRMVPLEDSCCCSSPSITYLVNIERCADLVKENTPMVSRYRPCHCFPDQNMLCDQRHGWLMDHEPSGGGKEGCSELKPSIQTQGISTSAENHSWDTTKSLTSAKGKLKSKRFGLGLFWRSASKKEKHKKEYSTFSAQFPPKEWPVRDEDDLDNIPRDIEHEIIKRINPTLTVDNLIKHTILMQKFEEQKKYISKGTSAEASTKEKKEKKSKRHEKSRRRKAPAEESEQSEEEEEADPPKLKKARSGVKQNGHAREESPENARLPSFSVKSAHKKGHSNSSDTSSGDGDSDQEQVLVLCPTRELANQVAKDFKDITRKLTVACFYGGTPYNGQIDLMRSGIDILVGTPGRIKDHLQNGKLDLTKVKHVVLDEVDQMLDMGFAEQVEDILRVAYKKGGLRSNTVLEKMSKRTLRRPEKVVDDYFETDCQSLHGDIPQKQREITLKGFRNGTFKVLVATNVAARGLDIPEVDLVVQSSPPKDVESYIHRSGRTGRAGRTGICICFYQRKEEYQLRYVEQKAGVCFDVPAADQKEIEELTEEAKEGAFSNFPLSQSTINLLNVDLLKSGIDILVGTPGRIKDHIQNSKLELSSVKHVVLDEVDHMLDMGFADQVEEILGFAYKKGSENNPQTLLFSATCPRWVYDVAKKYMKDEYEQIDLIGKKTQRTATTVEHLAIQCRPSQRAGVLGDIIQVYSGSHGRTIVFCETKKEANELAMNASLKQGITFKRVGVPSATDVIKASSNDAKKSNRFNQLALSARNALPQPRSGIVVVRFSSL
ncbi:storkhead-box protein hypothetical protein [Limosa lapponica baueri]|uniref:RNA helicase n=1 Tax=Limosa lapponica baueri TaxID=1758121 RepID=A0A2I0TIU8_LIMLA|nr:storkhead-box protein hypothetical protein [Limosa lapponica baueri]